MGAQKFLNIISQKLNEFISRYKSLKDIKTLSSFLSKNKKNILIASAIDFLFLFLTTAVVAFFQLRAFDHLYALLLMIGDSTGGLIKSVEDPIAFASTPIVSNPEFIAHFQQVVFYLILMCLVIMLLWVITQSLSWRLAHRIAERKNLKRTFLSYFGSFFVSTVLFSTLTIITIFYFIKKYIDVGLSINPLITTNMVVIIYFITLGIIWYFGSVGYALHDASPVGMIRDSFGIGIKKFKKLLPSLITIAILLCAVLGIWDLLMKLLFAIAHSTLAKGIGFVYGVLIFLPSLTISRIILIKSVKSVKKRA